MKKKDNLLSLEELVDKEVGIKGSKKRIQFDADYEVFKLGVLLQQARKSRPHTRIGG